MRDRLDQANHAVLETHFARRLDRALLSLPDFRALNVDMQALVTSKPATLVPFDRWVLQSDSGVARLARAEFRLHRAWLARGGQFAYKTHPDAFARMEEQLILAREDFAVAQARLGPRCDVCRSGLLETLVLGGERTKGVALVDEGLQAMNGGMATPLNYLRFLHPRWGGSWEEMKRFVDRFAKDFPEAPGVPLLRGVLLSHQADAWLEAGEAQRAVLLLTEAVRIDPENGYLWGRLTAAALKADDADLCLRASEKALAIDPDAVDVLNARANFLLEGAQPLDAVPLLERAVALGSDWALRALLPIVASGQHGFKPDPERAVRLCRSAIDAQLPAGFACMGGLHFFGIGGPPDKPKALQWFIEGADRGVASAMVDAGLMLWRGDGGPRDEDRAIAYWLRGRAAGEPRAEGLLSSHLSTFAYWRQVRLPDLQTAAGEWLKNTLRVFWLAGQGG